MLTFLSGFYWLLLPQLMIQAIYYAPWNKARKRGVLGLLWELIKCLTLTNIHSFRMVASDWSPAEVHELLAGYGVPSFGFAYYDDYECIFHVPANRWKWAETILLESGVTLT